MFDTTPLAHSHRGRCLGPMVSPARTHADAVEAAPQPSAAAVGGTHVRRLDVERAAADKTTSAVFNITDVFFILCSPARIRGAWLLAPRPHVAEHVEQAQVVGALLT